MSVQSLVKAARDLSNKVSRLTFDSRITHIYNPLEYAWEPYLQYLHRFAQGHKKVLFLGMNPGPWGMAQTGIPFGEIESVRDWMGIDGEIVPPGAAHPKRPIEGFSCTRSEVSGRRLWNLMRDRFGSAEQFFTDHFVSNYCPLVFMESSGKNFTPDKLASVWREELFQACDHHLRQIVLELQPKWLLGVGKFAEKRLANLFAGSSCSIASILHPSPASPMANRGWAEAAANKMISSEFGTDSSTQLPLSIKILLYPLQ